MSGRMRCRESRWQSDCDGDNFSDTSSQISESGESYKYPYEDARQRLRRLFHDALYSDVTFVVDVKGTPKQEVRAHKAILAAGSDWFAVTLFGCDKSGRRTVTSEYVIRDVTYEAFKNVVEYLYTDDVFFENDSVVMETLSAARLFRVRSLVSRCESFFESKEITESNACSTLHLARTHRMETLQERCERFIQENTREVLRSRDFKNSPMVTVNTITRLPRLNLDSERELFMGVLGWTEARLQQRTTRTRRQAFEPFLKNIRFLTMSCEEFRDLVEQWPDVFTAEEALDMVLYLSCPAQNEAKLPSWCNRNGQRCFKPMEAPSAFGFPNDRKMAIALKPTGNTKLHSLTCMLELKCTEGRFLIKGLKLTFGDPVTEHSVIGHMVIKVCGVSGYSFNEHIRVENSKEIVVRFTQSLIALGGQTLAISAQANEVRNYCFLQFDASNSLSQEGNPFECSLRSIPKQNRLFFISEVLYCVLGPRRVGGRREGLYPNRSSKCR